MKSILICLFILIHTLGVAQTAPTVSQWVGPTAVDTSGGAIFTVSLQAFTAVEEDGDATLFAGWFPYIFSTGSTSLPDVLLEEVISVTPNPAIDFIHLRRQINGSEDWEVRVFETGGKLLHKGAWKTNDNYELNIANWNKGVYMILIQDTRLGKGRIEKFVKL